MTDELDERILAILTQDARISNREVARLTGVSETAVRKRLRKIEASGVAKVAAVVDHAAVGLNVSAFVRLSTRPALTRAIAISAAAVDHVSFVGLTTGEFNVTLVVTASDREDLARIIHDELRCLDGVVAIETLEIIDNRKHRLDVVAIKPDGIS